MSKMTGDFIARMEQILWLYNLPYDPKYPVICFDERPCFLIGDKVEPIPMRKGKVKKEHYSYEKHGSCVLLMAIEPLTGKRFGKVYKQRRKQEYADFMFELSLLYTDAHRIRLVQENLNTHNSSSFYQNMEPEKAFGLTQKFEFYFTPKSASWLNMVEIEFSALSKQCLSDRIPSQEELEKRVMAVIKDRNDKKVKFKWQFTKENARDIMHKSYTQILTKT
ncbi:IS630 family transposase [Flammeovirga sp. SJP92]|uniref:IS630 family transposase n=1 Tax=Flammeovirga sp. SJP92 TaxID=1775430 RepID=UPI0020A469E6|nr:IS630 family transposase [Flammeovirga sp. SJP92]